MIVIHTGPNCITNSDLFSPKRSPDTWYNNVMHNSEPHKKLASGVNNTLFRYLLE